LGSTAKNAKDAKDRQEELVVREEAAFQSGSGLSQFHEPINISLGVLGVLGALGGQISAEPSAAFWALRPQRSSKRRNRFKGISKRPFLLM
jgi:hypothetical protein